MKLETVAIKRGRSSSLIGGKQRNSEKFYFRLEYKDGGSPEKTVTKLFLGGTSKEAEKRAMDFLAGELSK